MLIGDLELTQRFADAYSVKCQWDMFGFDEPIYQFRPAVGFGFNLSPGEFTASATRWEF
jgi:hypothetical protein